jgi:hypothetical protein
MHVQFKIHYRNNLKDKKDSYLILIKVLTFSVKDRYQLNYFICLKDFNAETNRKAWLWTIVGDMFGECHTPCRLKTKFFHTFLLAVKGHITKISIDMCRLNVRSSTYKSLNIFCKRQISIKLFHLYQRLEYRDNYFFKRKFVFFLYWLLSALWKKNDLPLSFTENVKIFFKLMIER